MSTYITNCVDTTRLNYMGVKTVDFGAIQFQGTFLKGVTTISTLLVIPQQICEGRYPILALTHVTTAYSYTPNNTMHNTNKPIHTLLPK